MVKCISCKEDFKKLKDILIIRKNETNIHLCYDCFRLFENDKNWRKPMNEERICKNCKWVDFCCDANIIRADLCNKYKNVNEKIPPDEYIIIN